MKKWYNILLLVINIILYLVLIALWISIPDELTLNIALTLACLAMTAILIYLNKEKVSYLYQSPQFKKFTETVIFVALVFSLMGMANYLAFKHAAQFDFSAFKVNSLTDQSKSILKKINGGITFKIFARKQEAMLWLPIYELYRAEKNDIRLEKIDIDVRPDLVADYQISDASTLVIEYQGKRQYVTERDELNITNALIKISRAADPIVYFIQGHGEANVDSAENEGQKFIFEAIKNSAIDVQPVNLVAIKEIPSMIKTVILWGPKKALMNSEINVLEKFLDRKGNLLVALDPDLNGDVHGGLRSLLKRYRLLLRNDIIIDKKNFVSGSEGSIPFVQEYDHEHAITKSFKGQVFFPLASSIEEIPAEISPVKGRVSMLATSSAFPESWGETSIQEFAQQKVSFTKGKDVPGPLNLVAAFEDERNKIVLFGNSSFVLNAYLKFGTNYSLFLNSLSWLVDEDRLISFNLPIVQNEPLFISQQQMGIVFYFSVLFSPLLLIGISIYMYRRRRDR